MSGEHYVGVKFNGGTGWNDFQGNFNGISGYLVEYGTWSDAMDLNFYSSQATEVIFTQIPQGVTITPPATTSTNESGASLDFDVVLTINPLGDVVVPFSVSDATEASFSPTQLTFTSSNWDIAQTVTVTGTDDELFDGDISFQLISGDPTSTADANYDNLTATDVLDFTLTNEDDDGISASVVANVTCYDGNDGSALASVSSGNTQDYSFTWTDANNNVVSSTTSLTNATAGIYTITVEDADNVSESTTVNHY